MRYNTGKASKQISASDRFWYGMKVNSGQPTFRQKKYLAFLMAKAHENNVDISAAVGKMKIENRKDHNVAIDKLRQAIIDAGIPLEETERQKEYRKSKEAYSKKKTLEALTTNWTYMTEKKPDRHFVKTMDEDGFVRIYEWNGKNFLDGKGNEVVTGRHRYKTPIAWARLE